MSRINRLTEHLRYAAGDRYNVDRCTGRSTGIALQLVKSALDNPEVWCHAHDHSNNKFMGREVVRLAQHVVESLGLQFFEFREDAIRCCHVVEEVSR